MSEPGEAKAKEDTLARGAKPRLEERVPERGWQPTYQGYEFAGPRAEAARQRAIDRARHSIIRASRPRKEGA